jgi:hypothetical protein
VPLLTLLRRVCSTPSRRWTSASKESFCRRNNEHCALIERLDQFEDSNCNAKRFETIYLAALS